MTTKTEELEIRMPVNRNAERRAQVQVFYAQIGCHHCHRGKMESTGEAHEKGTIHQCTHANCGSRCGVPGEPFPHLVYEVSEDRPGLDGMRRVR